MSLRLVGPNEPPPPPPPRLAMYRRMRPDPAAREVHRDAVIARDHRRRPKRTAFGVRPQRWTRGRLHPQRPRRRA